ncbi:DUF4352 domain-containing protein [Microbispora sp. NBRC 16548]|uniref:DUF4352 domain-containing protein n=1 Tax=Microbispora sp. NBRC 16548 TaxID=3030994 RepID=UPI0024A34970|nr:DUF4352 domain-containing protein [Microbispora sp. NBRC 16548]GLX10256.1 hypothetical protein Misp03_71820 [Microbispora sp. NBRC 16548]
MAVTQRETTRTAGRATRKKLPRRGVGRRIATGAAGIVLAAAAVYAQQNFTMSYEQRTSFLTYKGGIGETVETNRFTVKVNSVSAAHAVDTVDFSNKVTKVETSNLFLLIDVSATTAREPVRLSPFAPPMLLTADGRRYRPTDKVSDSLTLYNKWLQPGFWSSGVLIYEMPTDAVPGARLVFNPDTGGALVDSLSPEAEIDLGLSGSAATRLISQAEDYHSLVSKSG